MILGVGCDLVSVLRIENLIQKTGHRFLKRVLTSLELQEYERRNTKSWRRGCQYVASRYAAKEAFSKAMGTGVGQAFSFLDLSVLNDQDGRPILSFSDKLSLWMQERHAVAHVSFSDEQSMAISTVVLSCVSRDVDK